uniref:ATP synthase complex subunit 8 n=1 Tax=Anoplophora horsfieldi TaxID=217633 RepID=A0A8A4YPE0_9CUCU|nr:ATP synthase F0 subunit 8 [Anoplophora horsfieldi]QTE20925.1 ATP synthase F0 subunit 8 [Anoplophora horsfieldi]QTV20877.1 ATP synthase F0 subunit 8 [Anoplophora horsfieldi]
MPQMAPLNWLMLFMFFLFIFFTFNILNFYSFNYNIKFSKKMKSILNYNWKW